MNYLSMEHKVHLFLLLVFSFCLTTPILHGLGYAAPGLSPRILATVLTVFICGLVHAFPLLAAAAPPLLLLVTALTYWAAPHTLERVYLLLYKSLILSPHFWPMLIMGASGLLFYLLLFGLKNPLLLLLTAGAITFVPLWYMYVDSAYPAAVFYVLCWFFLASYKKGGSLFGKRWQDQEDGLQQGWMRYTASVLLMALFLSLILPKGLGPVPWTSLQNWAGETFPVLSELRGGEDLHIRGDGGEFGLFSSGFQDTTNLGGPLRQDPTLLLEVRGWGGMYLKGSVKDLYSGRSWVNSRAAAAGPDSFPLPTDALLAYLETVDLHIKHRRLRTKTVFGVLYPQEVVGLAQNVQVDLNSGVSLPGGIPLGHEYRVRGWQLAYRGDFAALEKEGGMQEEVFAEFSPFLQLPAGLPPRVRELALEISGHHQKQYQKVKALESYLRQNYSYNAEMPALPQNRDFVDYFLFDMTEGYCTYFASSLAVMARAVGIPTRYVEGFTVPRDLASDGFYPVAGTNAHAWVEAYIFGIGWLPFEATPAFNSADALPMRRETADSSPDPGAGQVPPPAATNGGDLPGPGLEDHLPPVPGGQTGGAIVSTYLAGFFLAAVLLGFILVSGFSLLRFHRIKKYMKQLHRQKPHLRAAGYYNLSLLLLERLGAGKYPGETPREYSRRVIRQVYTWSLNFNEISEGMNLALYSGKEDIPLALAEDSERFFHYIFARYISKVGKFRAYREIIWQNKYLCFIFDPVLKIRAGHRHRRPGPGEAKAPAPRL